MIHMLILARHKEDVVLIESSLKNHGIFFYNASFTPEIPRMNMVNCIPFLYQEP